MLQEQVVPIEYVGSKPYKTDNVNHTKTVWESKGDTQLYPRNLAASLLRYGDVWRLGKAANVKAGEEVLLDSQGAVGQAAAIAAEAQKLPETQANASKEQAGGQANSLQDDAREGPTAAPSKSARSLE